MLAFLPSAAEDHMHRLEAWLRRSYGFRGQVVYGGSRILGEASSCSDHDYVLIAEHCTELFSLLRAKTEIRAFVRDVPKHQYLLTTRWLVAHGWTYVYGRGSDGATVASRVSPGLLRVHALRVAYQEFVASRLAREGQCYHLGKALLFALYSLALFRRLPFALVPPLFSVTTLLPHLTSLHHIGELDRTRRILQYKMSDTEQIVDNYDYAHVASVLRSTTQAFFAHPFSFRSYLIYNIFALRQRQTGGLWHNPDRRIITEWQTLADAPVYAEFIRLREKTCQVFLL